MSHDNASTSETSVNFYQTTWRNKPEDSHLQTYRRENPKSEIMKIPYATAFSPLLLPLLESNILITVFSDTHVLCATW
jgi:hypothetical protein